MRLPLRVRMTAWYVALLALILAGAGAFVVAHLRSDLTNAIDRPLGPAIDEIAYGYRTEGPAELRDAARTVVTGERASAQALDAGGRVLVSYGDPLARAPMLGAADRAAVLRGEFIRRTARLGAARHHFRLVARPVIRGGRREIVVAGESLAPVDRSVHRVIVLVLLAGPAALAATALGGWWLARRSLRPIERITSAAEAIGVERLDERVTEPRTSDEVARLARTFNTMLDRIEHGVEAQRRLVADAAHELRTPLAAMRAELDVSLRADDLAPAAREVLESSRDEVDRMARLVDDLLTLASAEEDELGLAAEPLDLRDIAARVVAHLGAEARRRGVELEAGGGPALVIGDEPRLRHALRNLVENAVKFGPPGTRVEVTTAAPGSVARVTVADQGPGVAPDLRDQIFERFFRADPSRTRSTGGTGLGLAIVREIVAAHGGTVWMDPREPRGSAFTIELPALQGRPEPVDEETRGPHIEVA